MLVCWNVFLSQIFVQTNLAEEEANLQGGTGLFEERCQLHNDGFVELLGAHLHLNGGILGLALKLCFCKVKVVVVGRKISY